MKQMDSLVRAAIGIDDKRGDQLSVENVRLRYRQSRRRKRRATYKK